MTAQDTKSVIVIDESLPLGILANTAAILGITLGKQIPELVGKDAMDASGQRHLGIVTIPVPILKGSRENLRSLMEKLRSKDFQEVIAVDFSDVAQGCNIYSEYIERAAATPEEKHNYLGLAIFGARKKVNKLTGSMPLLR